MVAPDTAPDFEFHAGSLALNFLNTVWERVGYASEHPEPPHELFTSYRDVERWCEKCGAFSSQELPLLGGALKKAQREGSQTLEEIKRAREDLFVLFRTVILEGQPHQRSLDHFNRTLASFPVQQAVFRERRVLLEEPDHIGISWIIRRVYRDALTVLLTSDHKRLRFCSAPDCGWIFLDTSKNGRRRWCDMNDCGNRDKVKRFFERKRRTGDRS